VRLSWRGRVNTPPRSRWRRFADVGETTEIYRREAKSPPLEVASIAFVWSAAMPLPAFLTYSGQKPGPTFIYILEENMKQKDIKFSTRMAAEDRATIKELAKQSHMSMSNYVTACCLGQQIIIIEGLKEVLKELKAIGNNLNQMVTLAHIGKVTVINLGEVRLLLADIRTTIREIAERKRW